MKLFIYNHKMFGNFYLLIFLFLFSNVRSADPIVNTTNGLIEGTHFTTWHGRVVHAFLGIPYASPLKPDTRFKSAKMTMHWKGVYPTKKFGQSCIQMVDESHDEPLVNGGDDCLFLNIFTPSLSTTSRLEVIFFIHGGGFMKGSSILYTPYFLMDRHNIVFVTINYRLGPFGFLSTEDDVIPGNLGLKDQVLALRWVRNNIDNFGGDKDKITLMGEDAGAASVHLHYLSPLSKHLFKQGISLGGSAFCPWALTKYPRLKAEKLADNMACQSTTSQGILACFQNYEEKLIMTTVKRVFMPWYYLPSSPFGPVIEKKGSFAFLSDHPHRIIELRRHKDAPWLVGLTSHEGLHPGAKFVRDHDIMEELDEKWHDIAPILLDYNHTVPRDMLHIVNDKIRQYYFEDKEISVKLRRAFIAMLGDRFYVADTERAMRLQAAYSTAYVFLYKFGYRGRYSWANSLCRCRENMGASHGDDLLYLFKFPGYNVTETSFGQAMVKQMVDVIISFLDKGIPKTHPDTIWKPVLRDQRSGHNLNYMEILTSQQMSLENAPDLGNVRFWSNLHLAELKNVADDHKKFFDEL